MQGKLTIEQAYIQALQIDMIANRTDGNQFTFSQANPSDDKKIVLIGSIETLFNIPGQQGKYDPIDISLTLGEDPYQLVVTPGTDGNPPTVDYATFIQQATPSMFLSCKFNNRGESTKVIIALNIPNQMRVEASQLGSTAVSLSKQNRAKFSFRPDYLLQDLTSQHLEDAVTFDYLGEKTILIHEDFNSDLYDMIIDRVFEYENILDIEMIEIRTNG
jgi:hypothetical protein